MHNMRLPAVGPTCRGKRLLFLVTHVLAVSVPNHWWRRRAPGVLVANLQNQLSLGSVTHLAIKEREGTFDRKIERRLRVQNNPNAATL